MAISSRQGGYILATTALMLIPLMVFAAFAVDVGGWYVEADQAQRAADAGALAGVVHAPNLALVKAEVGQVAARNGVIDADGVIEDTFDPSIPMPVGQQYPRVIAQIVTDVEVRVWIVVRGESHFGSVVMDEISIVRYATAELTRPLPMGNPTSAIGTGVDTEYPGDPDNFFLNILPPGTTRRSGDLITNPNDGIGPNGSHDSDGYLFGIDVPSAGSYELQVRLTCHSWQNGTLRLSLYRPDLTVTPNYLRDNLTVITPEPSVDYAAFSEDGDCNSRGYSYSDLTETATWQTVHTGLGAAPGDWLLQAEHGSGGRILYALRVINTSGGPAHCSKLSSTSCPTVRPYNWLGTVTHRDMFAPAATTPTEIYLADVAPVNKRSTLEITMFDPADGIEQVRILAPPKDSTTSTIRSYVDFEWEVVPEAGNAAYSPNSSDKAQCGTTSCVTAPVGETGDPWFQNKLVRIAVDLDNLGAAYGGQYTCTADCWFKVEYSNNGNTQETTTWKARIIGDPLRLIE